MLVLRFQATVTGSPYLGKWSVLVDLIDADEIEHSFHSNSRKINRLINKEDLTAKDVAAALNIIPSFIEDSLFWAFDSSPATGTTAPIQYDGFLEVIRGGEQFLAGPINDGQPGILQIKDVVKDRSECTD